MAEMIIPFSVYDFFVYLIPGALVLLVGSLLFWSVDELKVLWSSLNSFGELRFVLYGGGLVLAYVLGQFTALVSSLLLESIVVNSALKSPTDHMFRDDWNNWNENIYFFRNYREPFRKGFVSAFRKIYESLFPLENYKCDRLFDACHGVVREKCPNAVLKLDTISLQYGFAGNLAIALLFAIPMLLRIGYSEDDSLFYYLGAACSVLFCVMLLRYLNFFRLYYDEVFMSFYTYITLRLVEKEPSPTAQAEGKFMGFLTCISLRLEEEEPSPAPQARAKERPSFAAPGKAKPSDSVQSRARAIGIELAPIAGLELEDKGTDPDTD